MRLQIEPLNECHQNLDARWQNRESFIFNQMLAERVGFEPTVRVRAQRFSRPPRSTTPAPLRMRLSGGAARASTFDNRQ